MKQVAEREIATFWSTVQDLTKLIEAANISELTVKTSDFSITLCKQYDGKVTKDIPNISLEMPDLGGTLIAEPPPIDEVAPELPQVVSSPMIGTFFRIPESEVIPLCNIGERVGKGQVLGLVKAMNIYHEVRTECGGKISDILVEEGEVVSYGDPLFHLVPERPI